MKTLSIAIVAVVLTAAPLLAQDPLTAAKKAAQKAAAAENAHIAAEQRPEGGQNAAKPAAKSAAKPELKTTTTRPGKQPAAAPADTAGPRPTIMREVFEYARDGRRDPFVSLLTTTDLRPTLSDLKLTGILFDQSGRNSVATLQDITNGTKYRVSTGSTLGRMRVTSIRERALIFTIDEFGTTRRDSLVLRDTTKARPK